jgi:hypothetical protein
MLDILNRVKAELVQRLNQQQKILSSITSFLISKKNHPSHTKKKYHNNLSCQVKFYIFSNLEKSKIFT